MTNSLFGSAYEICLIDGNSPVRQQKFTRFINARQKISALIDRETGLHCLVLNKIADRQSKEGTKKESLSLTSMVGLISLLTDNINQRTRLVPELIQIGVTMPIKLQWTRIS